MRTTLDIDDDILAYAEETAARTASTAGKVLSNLARKALSPEEAIGTDSLNGFRLLRPIPRDGRISVTAELVERLLGGTD